MENVLKFKMKTCLRLAVVVSVFAVIGLLSFLIGRNAPLYIVLFGGAVGFGLGYLELRIPVYFVHFGALLVGFLFGTIKNPTMSWRLWLFCYLFSSVLYSICIWCGRMAIWEDRQRRAERAADLAAQKKLNRPSRSEDSHPRFFHESDSFSLTILTISGNSVLPSQEEKCPSCLNS